MILAYAKQIEPTKIYKRYILYYGIQKKKKPNGHDNVTVCNFGYSIVKD